MENDDTESVRQSDDKVNRTSTYICAAIAIVPFVLSILAYQAIQDALHNSNPRYQLDQKMYELCMQPTQYVIPLLVLNVVGICLYFYFKETKRIPYGQALGVMAGCAVPGGLASGWWLFQVSIAFALAFHGG